MNALSISKGRFSILLFLSSWTTLWFAGESPAQLDPEKNSPYLLQLVVQVADHPPFTPTFKDQIKRELRGGLQDALADLARVEVVDTHPQLKEIESKGLQAALETWKE